MTTRRRFRRQPVRRRRGTKRRTTFPRRRLASHVPGHFTNARTGGFMGLEKKFADIETNNDAFSSAWATMEDPTNDSISGVAQGDGESQRDGRKYAIHSIHIRYRIHVAASESQTTPLPDLFGRLCLVLDTQTNGAQLTASDVMDVGLTDDVLAFRNLQHSTKRFRVLMDKTFMLRGNDTNEGAANLFAQGAQSTPIVKFNWNFPTPLVVTCSATTGVIAAITDNSLHIIGVANLATALLNMQVRIRFTG